MTLKETIQDLYNGITLNFEKPSTNMYCSVDSTFRKYVQRVSRLAWCAGIGILTATKLNQTQDNNAALYIGFTASAIGLATAIGIEAGESSFRKSNITTFESIEEVFNDNIL